MGDEADGVRIGTTLVFLPVADAVAVIIPAGSLLETTEMLSLPTVGQTVAVRVPLRGVGLAREALKGVRQQVIIRVVG